MTSIYNNITIILKPIISGANLLKFSFYDTLITFLCWCMTEAESEMANVLPFILYYSKIHYFRSFWLA